SRRSGVSSPAASAVRLASAAVFRPVAMTRKPRAARWRAAWRPMPAVAPVMRTVGLVMGGSWVGGLAGMNIHSGSGPKKMGRRSGADGVPEALLRLDEHIVGQVEPALLGAAGQADEAPVDEDHDGHRWHRPEDALVLEPGDEGAGEVEHPGLGRAALLVEVRGVVVELEEGEHLRVVACEAGQPAPELVELLAG